LKPAKVDASSTKTLPDMPNLLLRKFPRHASNKVMTFNMPPSSDLKNELPKDGKV
jgi:hypothetical protein